MVDAIVNHMIWESKQFQDVLEKGEESGITRCFDHELRVPRTAPPKRTWPASTVRVRACRSPTTSSPARRACLGELHPQQVDIDTDSDKGWEYLMSIFDQMAASHVSYIRLDAWATAPRKPAPAASDPHDLKLISRLREEGVKRGLEILIEVHSYYKKQVEIRLQGGPRLRFRPAAAASALAVHRSRRTRGHWTEIRPNNAVTVLDTHDGIGVNRHRLRPARPLPQGPRARRGVDNLVNTSMQHPRRIPGRHRCRRVQPRPTRSIPRTTRPRLQRPALLGARRRAVLLPGRAQVYSVGRAAAATTWNCCAAPTTAADINALLSTRNR